MSTAIANETKAGTKGGKYLTFALGKEEYGLEILKVREIIGYMDITAVPRTPAYVKGVINLRGQVISVVDLRAKFAMEAAEKTDETCVIVVEIKAKGGRKLSTGIIVDRVSEVLNIAGEAIEEPPAFGTSVDTDSDACETSSPTFPSSRATRQRGQPTSKPSIQLSTLSEGWTRWSTAWGCSTSIKV